MIIIWDCKTGRREFLELIIKEEGFECTSFQDFHLDYWEEILGMNAKLVIISPELNNELRKLEIPKTMQVWILGEEVALPIEPLLFVDQITAQISR